MWEWYLLRTKTGEERKAQRHVDGLVERTFLPLGKTQIRQRGGVAERIAPLFPCYLFAQFSLSAAARKIQHTPGIRGIVRFGEQAAVVPGWVIDHLALRCADGPVALLKPSLSPGDAIKVLDGPFQQLEAVFDGYLSGTERVSVLLSIMSAERRVVLPTHMVAAAE
jgi:transcriptional antiterminator RfaH